MSMLGSILGGALGGLLGAVLWAAISQWTGYEVGWIAWGLGGLVGLGVHFGGKRSGGVAAGGTAVILAVAGILAGKWGAVWATYHGDELIISEIADVIVAEQTEAGYRVRMPPEDQADSLKECYPSEIWSEAARRWEALTPSEQDELRELPYLANPLWFQVRLADEVVEEFQQAGRPVKWPPGKDIESAWRQPDYPADIWAEAGSRWEAMSQPERDEYIASNMEMDRAMASNFESEVIRQGFLYSFSLYDILWVGLAVATAWRLGAGGQAREAPGVEGPG